MTRPTLLFLAALVACSKKSPVPTDVTSLQLHDSWVAYAGSGSLDATVGRDGKVHLEHDGEAFDADVDRALVDAFLTGLSKTSRGDDCPAIPIVEGTNTRTYALVGAGATRSTLVGADGACWKLDGANLTHTDELVSGEYALVHEISQLLPPRAATSPSTGRPIDWASLPSAGEVEIDETFSSAVRYRTVRTKLRRAAGGFSAEVTTSEGSAPNTTASRTIPSNVVDELLRGLAQTKPGECKARPWAERGGFVAVYTIHAGAAPPAEIVRRSRLCWKGAGATLSVDSGVDASADALRAMLQSP